MILSGKLIKVKRETKEFKGNKTKNKLWITLAEATIPEENMNALKEAFKDAGKSFTPDWIKNFDGYINLATEFELPVRLLDGTNCDSIEDAITDGLAWMGADAKVSVNVKEGAVYPIAIKLCSEGTKPDPFAEFDNE